MKFSTARVMTVYTGYCMGRGIGIAQDVFDHLYPGIMTLGCAAIQPKAALELERQFPQLRNIKPVVEGSTDYLRFLNDATAMFGAEMDVIGSVTVTDAEIREAFDGLAKRGAL